tara:strand:- start:249 stop:605 length:357 start_codon:yes stop_codon:yes gene_type:complete
MNSVKSLMNEYFSEKERKENILKFNSGLPVAAKKSSWETIEDKSIKIYKFKLDKVAAKFAVESIKHSFDSDANYTISYYKKQVKIKITSPSGYITEIEKELEEELDYLYKSIRLEYAK